MAEATPQTESTGFFKSLTTQSWFYAALLALIVALVFAGFLTSDKMLQSSDQFSTLGVRAYFQNSVKEHGQFPLWLNSRFSGMPTVDAIQGDLLYPVVMGMNLTMAPHRVYAHKMLLHIFLAGLFFYFLLYKGYNFSKPLAFVGGVMYMLTPGFFTLIYPGHNAKMYVVALMPFVFWRLKALVDKQTLINASLFSLAVGLTILTSHIQIAYFVMWGAFVYWLFSLYAIKKDLQPTTLKPYFKSAGLFWGASFTGLFISAMQFFPTLYYFLIEGMSTRAAMSPEQKWEHATSWSLHWPEFFSLWIPEFVNSTGSYWGENAFKLNSEYVGGLMLLFALLALIKRPNRERIFWTVVALFAIFFAMGKHTPIFHLSYNVIPGVKSFRASAMMIAWVSFPIVVLALMSLKDVLDGSFSSLSETLKKRWTKGLLIGLGGITVIALLFSMQGFVETLLSLLGASPSETMQMRHPETGQAITRAQGFVLNFKSNFVPALWIWWILAATTLSLLLGVIHNKIKPIVFVTVVALLALIDVYRVDHTFIALQPSKEYTTTPAQIKSLQAKMKEEPFRCYVMPAIGQVGFQTFGNQNPLALFGLESVGGFHDFEIKWHNKFRGPGNRNYPAPTGIIPLSNGKSYLLPGTWYEKDNFLDLANAKYYLTRDVLNQDQQTNRIMWGSVKAVPNPTALGRVSFVSNYKVLDEDAILVALAQDKYDIRTTTALLEEPSQKPLNTTPEGVFSATWSNYTPNYRSVSVTIPNDGFLRISEVYYPKWKITVDGKEVPFYRADYTWMAIPITQGSHVVEIRPGSLFFFPGLTITLSVLAILIGYWTFYITQKRKEQ